MTGALAVHEIGALVFPGPRQEVDPRSASATAKIPMGRFLTIYEIAAMVAWIAGPECSFSTGFTFDLSGGRATY